jgi:hypothetical protein
MILPRPSADSTVLCSWKSIVDLTAPCRDSEQTIRANGLAESLPQRLCERNHVHIFPTRQVKSAPS